MSSSSSTSYRRCYSRNQDVTHKTHCDCDPPHPIPVQTSWTIDNPGRRFKGCPIRDKGKKCGVYGFLDLELPGEYYKQLVYNLHEENKALKKNKMCGVMEDSSKGYSNYSINQQMEVQRIGCPIRDKGKKCGVYGFLDLELPGEYYKQLVYNLHEENKALKKNKMCGVMEDSSNGYSNYSINQLMVKDLKADLTFVKSNSKCMIGFVGIKIVLAINIEIIVISSSSEATSDNQSEGKIMLFHVKQT
ncbi:hypothetical protein Tco_0485195 [Tanacetum coccineum]